MKRILQMSTYLAFMLLTTNMFAQTQMKATYCGTTLTSMTDAIYADQVQGATAYWFRFNDVRVFKF